MRTGASFVRAGKTGVVVDRLPPGVSFEECDADAVALDGFIDAIEQAQTIDQPSVRVIAAAQFNTARIVNKVMSSIAGDSDLGYTKDRGTNKVRTRKSSEFRVLAW